MRVFLVGEATALIVGMLRTMVEVGLANGGTDHRGGGGASTSAGLGSIVRGGALIGGEVRGVKRVSEGTGRVVWKIN